MKEKVTVLITCFNDQEFIELSLYALSKLTKNPYKVYILDNGSKLENYKKLEKICNRYDNVFLERWETDLRGSIAHGTALNYLVKKVDTPYFSILDADATWLIKDWDEILINLLNKKTKVIGTQAPMPKPQDFPLMFAILFETRTFNRLNIDFRPGKDPLIRDTAWELKPKYLASKLKGKIIEMKNTRNYQRGPFKDILVAEYYIKNNGPIFASHFGRGATQGANKYSHGEKVGFVYKLPFSNKLRYFRGYIEKKRWIKICRRIIDEQ